MAINVVPVTGGGGGQASPQGRSVQQQSRLNPYVAPKSGLSSFSDAIQPYLMMAMKKQQDLQKRKAIAGMKSAYDAGDTDAFNKGDNPYPSIGMGYESTLAKQEEAKQKRLSNEQMKKLLYENKLNVQDMQGGQKLEQIDLKGDIQSKIAKEQHGYDLESMSKKYGFSSDLLSQGSKSKMALLKTGIQSKEKMQGIQNAFADGQAGDKRKHQSKIQRMKQRHQQDLQDSGAMDQESLLEMKIEHQKEIQQSELAYKEGALNKNITLKEWEINTVTDAKKEMTQLKERGATNRAEMKNAMTYDVASMVDSGKSTRAEKGILSKEGMQIKELTQEATLAEKAEIYGLKKQRDAQQHKKAFEGIKAKNKFDYQRIQNEADFLLKEAERNGTMDRLVYSEKWKTNRAMMNNVNKREMNSANIAGRSELQLKIASIKSTSAEKIADKGLEGKKLQFEMANAKDQFGRFDKISNKWEKAAEGFKSMQSAYSKVASSLVDKDGNANPTYAGDVSLIYNYMKMLDPKSVVHVREGQLMQDWGGLPGELVKLYNYMAGKKQKLAPEVREDYADRARELFSASHEQYEIDHKRYRKMASDWKLDPDETIINHSKMGMLPNISGMKFPTEPGMGADFSPMGETGRKLQTKFGGQTYNDSDFKIGAPIR